MDQWKIKHISITLKWIRLSNLYSQEELVWHSSLDRKTISLLETNQQEPLFSTISALAAIFEMAPSEFMKEIENVVLRNKNRH